MMEEKDFKPTPKMYTTLFNGITDTIEQLEEMKQELIMLQQKSEQLYIENKE